MMNRNSKKIKLFFDWFITKLKYLFSFTDNTLNNQNDNIKIFEYYAEIKNKYVETENIFIFSVRKKMLLEVIYVFSFIFGVMQ